MLLIEVLGRLQLLCPEILSLTFVSLESSRILGRLEFIYFLCFDIFLFEDLLLAYENTKFEESAMPGSFTPNIWVLWADSANNDFFFSILVADDSWSSLDWDRFR